MEALNIWSDIADARVLHGDCLEKMRELKSNSIDAIITDPPYGIGFMSKSWDSAVPALEWAQECLRVLKPGGHIVAFASTRTYHRLAVNLEDAGFQVRDMISWVTYQGFPKSLNISKQIDRGHIKNKIYKDFADYLKTTRERLSLSQRDLAKHFPSKTGGLTGCVWNWENAASVPMLEQYKTLKNLLDLDDRHLDLILRENSQKYIDEAEREVVGRGTSGSSAIWSMTDGLRGHNITKSATKEAVRFEGYGTGLKPAQEPACLARKPIEKGLTIAQNVLKWGTGGINIDQCRFSFGDPCWIGPNEPTTKQPSVLKSLDRSGSKFQKQTSQMMINEWSPLGRWPANLYQCSKPSRAEREQGLSHLSNVNGKELCRDAGNKGLSSPRAGAGRTQCEIGVKNFHPTVKPIKLFRWLCRLLGGEKGNLILDPFLGSGTTAVSAILEGYNIIGCERESDYLPIIRGRIDWAIGEYKRENAQLSLFEGLL